MYLILQPCNQSVRFAAFADDGELVYDGEVEIARWDMRYVTQAFQQSVIGKLKGHGKVMSHIGIMAPFGDIREPESATKKHFHALKSSRLRTQAIVPTELVFSLSQKLWPHLPHLLLSDTYLSTELPRVATILPFSYDDESKFKATPLLHNSYRHALHAQEVGDKKSFLSLSIDEKTSVALFEKGRLLDATVAFSPLSSLVGWKSPGRLDTGMVFELLERHRPDAIVSLINQRAGIAAMAENDYTFDQLLQIAGIVPRTDSDLLESLTIEMIEWVELAMQSFARALRHAIGSMQSSGSAEVSYVAASSPFITSDSPFWKYLLKGNLASLRLHVVDKNHLEAACRHIIEHHANAES